MVTSKDEREEGRKFFSGSDFNLFNFYPFHHKDSGSYCMWTYSSILIISKIYAVNLSLTWGPFMSIQFPLTSFQTTKPFPKGNRRI